MPPSSPSRKPHCSRDSRSWSATIAFSISRRAGVAACPIRILRTGELRRGRSKGWRSSTGCRRSSAIRTAFRRVTTRPKSLPTLSKLVGQKPILGRDFTPSDEMPGAAPVAILSYSFWERRYGKDPAILGQAVRINGTPTAVIGIMPEGFSFPQKLDLWVPLVPTPDVRKRDARDTWFVFGRVADGVTIEAARAEMETIGKRLERAYPATNQGFLPQVRNFREFFIFENEDVIYTSMWGAVGFLLLITCANLANLLLARAMERSREMSVRIALGAGRWRIIRQLLIESLMLSSVGAILRLVDCQMGRIGLCARRAWSRPVVLEDPRLHDGLPRARLSRRDFDRNGIPVRFGACAPALAARRQQCLEGGWPRRRRRRLAEGTYPFVLVIAEVALAVVLARGCRSHDPQLSEYLQRRPGRQNRKHPHGCHRSCLIAKYPRSGGTGFRLYDRAEDSPGKRSQVWNLSQWPPGFRRRARGGSRTELAGAPHDR